MSDLNICRICINIDVRGYKLDEHNLRNYYEHVLRQKVNPKDGLPQWVCYECAMMLHKFHKFKEKCFRGQLTLKQISWSGDIDYDSVALTKRYSENLISSVGVIVANKRVKTITVKHEHYTKPKPMEVEKVMLNLNSKCSMKHEDMIEIIGTKKMFENTINNEKPDEQKTVEKDEIKIETASRKPLKTEDVPNVDIDMDNDDIQNTDNDTGSTNNNIGNLNDEMNNINNNICNTDHIDNAKSSENENIFLDTKKKKKAVKGESKLVFIDGVEPKTKKKKQYIENARGKVQKLARPKKDYLNSQYWLKFNLNEDDAMREFKQRENSDQYVNANYKCHNCLKGFSKIEMLMRHVKLRHEEACGPLECRFCHMRFRQKYQLYTHIKQHYTVYHCLRCDMKFRLEASAIFHEDCHSGVTRKCKHCGEEFKHASTYYTHLRMLHRSAHVCTRCGASFVSDVGLQQHKRIKHYDISNEASNEAATPAANTYCEKCDIKFVTQAAYDEHLTHSNMHGTADSEIVRKNHLKGNKNIKMDMKELRKKKPTTCRYCGKHFMTQKSCMKHHLVEHPRRSFFPPDKKSTLLCEVCGASLAAVSIASHMNRHTREHVYPCAICGMQFKSKSSHRRHQVTHTGERPYPCPLCEKRFTQKNSMQLHYRTFHLKQPYPKRNRRKKNDLEMPILECAMNRDSSDTDSNDTPLIARSRPAL